MRYPEDNPELIRSQAEIFGNLPDISSEEESILAPRVRNLSKKPETLTEMVNRLWRIEGHKPIEVSRRAAQRGFTISAAYIEDLARGRADNPTADKIAGVAAGFNLPLIDVIATVFGKTVKELVLGLSAKEEALYRESKLAELWQEWRQLSPTKQKEKDCLIEAIKHEIQRDL